MNESFDDELPNLEARNRDLTAHMEALQRKINADDRPHGYSRRAHEGWSIVALPFIGQLHRSGKDL